jgi:hypothetical protein
MKHRYSQTLIKKQTEFLSPTKGNFTVVVGNILASAEVCSFWTQA